MTVKGNMYAYLGMDLFDAAFRHELSLFAPNGVFFF